MNSKITIKRKKQVGINKEDLKLLNSNASTSYIGFLFVYYYTPKPNNPKKILLNHSYILLKNQDKFPLVKVNFSKDNIDNNFISEYIKENYSINNPKLIKKIYDNKNFQLYLINLNNKNIKIKNFSWRTYLDFYTYDYDSNFDDIYYNIIYKDNNLHLNHKFYGNNHINVFIKLIKIYNNLIADNIVKHDIIQNIDTKNKLKLKMI